MICNQLVLCTNFRTCLRTFKHSFLGCLQNHHHALLTVEWLQGAFQNGSAVDLKFSFMLWHICSRLLSSYFVLMNLFVRISFHKLCSYHPAPSANCISSLWGHSWDACNVGSWHNIIFHGKLNFPLRYSVALLRTHPFQESSSWLYLCCLFFHLVVR